MSHERDTKFAGFAKLLEAELSETLEVYFDVPNATEEQIRDATRLRIAQRAYDLAYHIILHEDVPRNIQVEPDDYLRGIPDLAECTETPMPVLLDRSTWPEQEVE